MTLIPTYEIYADGTDVTGNFQGQVGSIVVTDEAGLKADKVEIILNDTGYAIALPKLDTKLDIFLGFKGQALTYMGKYDVDDLGGDIFPPTLKIEAKAADMKSGLKSPKTRSFEHITLGGLVAKIAAEHGLKSAVSEDLNSVLYPHIAQTQESDLHLLTRLARGHDAIAKLAGGTLILVKRGQGKAADGTTLPVTSILKSQISRGTWSVTSRGRFGRVEAEWVDQAGGQTHKVTAGDKDPLLTLRHRYAEKAHAQAAAKAALENSTRGSGQIDMTLAGFFGGLTAEGQINLLDIKPELCGVWGITSVTHRLLGSLTTTVRLERDNEKGKA
ncbi:MAG: contractile injection system protein, VgrG/Pvc8 family [Planktomarina sp.]